MDGTIRDDRSLRYRKRLVAWLCSVAVALCGCQNGATDRQASQVSQQRSFTLTAITAQEAQRILSELDLGTVSVPPQPNTILVSGTANDLDKVTIVLGAIDTNEPYVVETLGPASMARTLPSNSQIAQAVGGIVIGTFAHPAPADERPQAIIDVHRDSVVAIIPARFRREVVVLAKLGVDSLGQMVAVGKSAASIHTTMTDISPPTGPAGGQEPVTADRAKSEPKVIRVETIAQAAELAPSESEPNAVTPVPAGAAPSGETASPQQATARLTAGQAQGAVAASRGILKPSRKASKSHTSGDSPPVVPLDNGTDVLELSLPEKIELVQLLDLAGEYLHLDCIYDAEKIGNQMITLKLHSKIRSEIRVRDLYTLLETILKFKGLVMTRQQGNLVTIVPATDALSADPQLIDPNTARLQAGDVVVTRVFELQHVDVASVTNLLQSMKLSVAVSPIEDNQTLFVTCYANRMDRIEQLVEMIDKPGRPKEFRFRQLRHTAVGTLVRKVLALAQELEDIPITIGTPADAAAAAQKAPRRTGSTEPQQGQPTARQGVYLDMDERTNRILMIGFEEQLTTVEGLIDTLDVPDLRSIHVYEIEHVEAQEVVSKLTELGVIAGQAARSPKTGPAAAAEAGSTEEPQVVLLEATNSLLINAKLEQHEQLRRIIDYIDVVPEDKRIFKVYTIEHVQADDVAMKLQQLAVTGPTTRPTARLTKTSPPAPAPATPAVMTSSAETITTDYPQVVVLEATNCLLIKATAQQHAQIEGIINHIDMETRKDTLPYEIYFLENQDPNRLAEVLGRLVQETVRNKEGKIEQILQKTDEPVTIIPDSGTFSLIVHASRKNQDWIASLIEKLDKRRPQVLIDVTLVEITETDAFTYDLNLIQSFPNLTATSGLTGTIVPGENPVTSSDIIDRLDATGRDRFMDYQSAGGQFRGFYGDRHINLLLDAMRSKNYGRILAKPKILVNDNEPGMIKTADTTYVVKRSSVPVSSGGAGTEATLIETAVDYQSYEAGITLNITPHISQGDLLRLDIQLTRSDFRETEDLEKPPDKTSSELKTTAFVPDGSTIILGGLLKLNQNKGGTKVPILGDIPLVGVLFRSINNKDMQSKLYVFVKAEVIRPAGVVTRGMEELESISEKNRQAFEKHEQEFQKYQNLPGTKPKPVEPTKVLEAR